MYVVLGAYVLYLLFSVLNQVFYFGGCGAWGRDGYEFTERVHIAQSFAFKSVQLWIVYAYSR